MDDKSKKCPACDSIIPDGVLHKLRLYSVEPENGVKPRAYVCERTVALHRAVMDDFDLGDDPGDYQPLPFLYHSPSPSTELPPPSKAKA